MSKHRVFVWVRLRYCCLTQLDRCIARDDDYFFGVLHSKPHELWARAHGHISCGSESGFRYTPTTTFETFPFPWPPGTSRLAIPASRPSPRPPASSWSSATPGSTRQAASEAELKKRTLTNLYNQRPDWLDLAHKKLDAAVFDAYGWPHDLADEEILERLLALNLERAGL